MNEPVAEKASEPRNWNDPTDGLIAKIAVYKQEGHQNDAETIRK